MAVSSRETVRQSLVVDPSRKRNKLPTRDQQQDRQNAWPSCAGQVGLPRRRGDRIATFAAIAHSDVRRPSVARSGHGGGLGPSERDSRNFGAALGPSPAPTLSVILFDRGDCQMSTWTEDDKQIAA